MMVTLTNVGTNYDTTAASRGLGIQDLDFTGITSVIFRVRVNHIGTGTQSWQLWNETDGAEIAVINDPPPAGDNRLLVTTASVSLTGIKTVRVRARSTVSSDDPLFYGASVLTSMT
jgi:hypothetical protein